MKSILILCLAFCVRLPATSSDFSSTWKNDFSQAVSLELQLNIMRGQRAHAKSRARESYDDGIAELKKKIEGLKNRAGLELAPLTREERERTYQFLLRGDIDTVSFNENWRQSQQVLNIYHPGKFPLDSGRNSKTKIFARDIQAKSVIIVFVNKSFVSSENVDELSVQCDSDFAIRAGAKSYRYSAHDKEIFSWSDAEKIALRVGEDFNSCEIKFSSSQRPHKMRGFSLISERKYGSEIYKKLSSIVNLCFLPSSGQLEGMRQFAMTQAYNSLSCPMETGNILSLEDDKKAVNQKFKALMGYELPDSIFSNQNPKFKLMTDQMPSLDAIYISYLVFRSDFYGRLLMRAIEEHLKRGVEVKMFIADVAALPKDIWMMDKMAEKYANFQYESYRFQKTKGQGLTTWMNQWHRANHMKIFATMSESHPENNAVVIGGRNIHDGFLFKDVPDYSDYPEMVQYGHGKEEEFVHWNDFEFMSQDAKFVQVVAAHFLTVWNRDTQNFIVRNVNLNVPIHEILDNTFFTDRNISRHYASFPYSDDHALLKFFIDMFDHAQNKIVILTPYFHPTKELGAAIWRAVDRGVDITLITSLDLKGEIFSEVLSDASKQGMNEFLHKIKMYEYITPGDILHAKIFLIDNEFSFVGSVNFNKRSFYHDLENGVMMVSSAYYRTFDDVVRAFMLNTRPIEHRLKVKWYSKIVLGLFDEEF